jgi:SAM-dependent methyltransferase
VPSVLHAGCGNEPLPAWLDGSTETRLDIDPDCHPDIVASITDLGDIGPFDLVFSSHCLEHLAPHDVGVALSEFRRVLKPGGGAVVIVPDLEDVRPTEEVMYEAPCGPITGLDMYYGLRSALQERPYMAHKTGFVRETLQAAMDAAGFAETSVKRLDCFNLMGAARK